MSNIEALLARFDGYLSEARGAGLDVRAEQMIADAVRAAIPGIVDEAEAPLRTRIARLEGLMDLVERLLAIYRATGRLPGGAMQELLAAYKAAKP